MTDSRRWLWLGGFLLLGWLLWYFYTGFGGPQELVSRLISVAVILQVLFMYREHDLYPCAFDVPLPIATRTRAYLGSIGFG